MGFTRCASSCAGMALCVVVMVALFRLCSSDDSVNGEAAAVSLDEHGDMHISSLHGQSVIVKLSTE